MISREEILNLAALARLKVGEDEVVALQKDISSILEYVGQVSAIATTDTKESLQNHNVMRDDTLAPVLGSRDALVAAFPKEERGYNVVRKIIQKDE